MIFSWPTVCRQTTQYEKRKSNLSLLRLNEGSKLILYKPNLTICMRNKCTIKDLASQTFLGTGLLSPPKIPTLFCSVYGGVKKNETLYYEPAGVGIVVPYVS